MFFGNVPCAMYIHTYCKHFEPLDYFLKPQTQGSAVTIICLDKATSTVPLQQPFHILRLSPACRATSRYIYLPPYYENQTIVINVSLHTSNINAINISTLDFRIWQHFSNNWTPPHLQKWAHVPEVPVAQLYRSMIYTSEPTHLFNSRMMTKTHPSYEQS